MNIVLKVFLKYIPLILLLISIVSRSIFLTFQDISNDEPFSIYHAQFGVSTIIEQLKNYNNPPLFELILHFWIKLFGVSPLATRIFPMLTSAFASLALYYLAKRHFSLKVAIIGSLLLSFSSLSIYYAQDCRAYALFLLLTILSMDLYLILFTKFRTTIALLFITVSSALIYTHYFGFIVLSIQGLHVLVYKKNFIKIALCYFLVLISYIPHFISLSERFQTSVSKGTWVEKPNGLESLYNMLWSFSNSPVITVLFISLLVLAALILLKTRQIKFLHAKHTLLLLWFLIPYLGLYFISYKVPVYLPRYLIFALPGFLLLISVILDAFPLKNKLKYYVIAFVVLAFMASADYRPNKKYGVKNAVLTLKNTKQKNDLVIVCPFDFINTFAYHYDRSVFGSVNDSTEYQNLIEALKAENIFIVNNADDLDVIRNSIEHKRVLYLESEAEFAMPGNGVKEFLNQHYTFKNADKFNNQTFLNTFEANQR